jgi:hypothetical protein
MKETQRSIERKKDFLKKIMPVGRCAWACAVRADSCPQAYHSAYNKKEAKVIGGVALVPFEAKFSKGPAPRPADGGMCVGGVGGTSSDPPRRAELDEAGDIIAETLMSFKSNVFFQTYDVKVSSLVVCGCCCFFWLSTLIYSGSQGPADRLLIFLTLFTSQALNRVTRVRLEPVFVCLCFFSLSLGDKYGSTNTRVSPLVRGQGPRAERDVLAQH